MSTLALAPMAGITDLPTRRMCYHHGADITVGEMITSQLHLGDSRKTRQRCKQLQDCPNKIIQLVGNEPETLVLAARHHEALGANIIDINMGCPAKKVCRKAAGSALLQDETLVAQILTAVVAAVAIPVTLKIRTGWDLSHRNGVQIAKLAQACGIRSLVVHGRTRACRFQGPVEYETIAAIKSAVSIPVFANGDINSPQIAAEVLQRTGADGLMIGRAAMGKPWLFKQIKTFLQTGEQLPDPTYSMRAQILCELLEGIYAFHGEAMGVKYARKHAAWFATELATQREFRHAFNPLISAAEQLACIQQFFSG